MLPASTRGRAALALLLCVPAPTIGSTIAYGLWPGFGGQAVYMALRLWLAAFPLLWLLRVERGRVSFSPLAPERRREAWIGALVLSALIAVAIMGAWELVGREWFEVESLREAARQSGLGT